MFVDSLQSSVKLSKLVWSIHGVQLLLTWTDTNRHTSHTCRVLFIQYIHVHVVMYSRNFSMQVFKFSRDLHCNYCLKYTYLINFVIFDQREIKFHSKCCHYTLYSSTSEHSSFTYPSWSPKPVRRFSEQLMYLSNKYLMRCSLLILSLNYNNSTNKN